MDAPSPVISVVMPCDNLLIARLSINKAWRDNEAMRINHAFGAQTFQFTDLHNAGPADRKISRDPGISGAIDDPSILDDEVVAATFVIDSRMSRLLSLPG